jgi:large subunit ribosomal protein L21e
MLVITMVKQSKGTLRKKTRRLKGKSRVSVAQAVKTYEVGQKVLISAKAKREGLPHLRYDNRHGIVVEKRGNAYVVEVNDMKKKKKIVVGSIHLKLAS